MAINRTPLIDDDGSGTTGTILNNAWQTNLYNQIDDADKQPTIVRLRYAPATITDLAVAVHHSFRPVGGENAVMWQLRPAGLGVGITGILQEPDQTSHLLVNTTGYPLWIYHQHPATAGSGNGVIGPGYTDYQLGVWGAIWIVYLEDVLQWLLVKG